ncbi:MAG: hypothetical protein NTX44_00100 [Ignavibacteriales bacterium]|nr:hypothetical protein [Ignavibacteriales bacterium]
MDVNKESSVSCHRNFFYVWIAAFIAILFYIPALPKLVPAHVHLPYSMNTFILLQIVVFFISATIFAASGAYLTPRIGFRAYLAEISIKKKDFWIVLKRQFFYGAPIGLAGAIVAYFIAPDFISYLTMVPFLTRLFGGVFEEVIMRWGLLTIIVWILWRIFQHGIGIPKKLLIYLCIFLSQILFACGHTPALINFGITNPAWSIFTIFIVSLPWGWLFWKHGLESAFIAHACFHAFVALFVAVKL